VDYKIALTEENIIEVEITGESSAAEQEKFLSEILILARDLKQKSVPIRILVNLDEMKFPGPKIRERGAQILRENEFEKIAGYSKNKLTRFISNMISVASGKRDKYRLFATRAEAVSWLKE
jgi:hypothetical protein